MDPDRKLYLLDAMALAYRAYFVFISRPRINSRGMNTSAVYGFTTTLIKLINDFELAYAAVVFDAEGGSFRNNIYPAYKATRDAPPEDLMSNLPYIKQVATALSIPVFEVAGVEADDVIGTLAKKAEADGARAVIVSPDKDFQQLLSPQISMFKPARRGEEFDLITDTTFREKHGLEPVQFIDVLALMGDASDNVPGIPGIGEKTALQLLQSYGDVENVLLHAQDIKGKRAREGLLEHADKATLSKTLVTIRTDVEVPLDWGALERGPLTREAVGPLFRELEFRTVLDRLGGDAPDEAPAEVRESEQTRRRRYDESATDYRLIANRSELMALERTLRTAPAIAMHAVCTEGPPIWADWVGLSVAWVADSACYIPIPLPDGTTQPEIVRILAPVLANTNLAKIGHDLKPLLLFLAYGGLTVQGRCFDTQVAHYLLAPDTNHDLDFVARQHLNYAPITPETVLGSGRQARTLRDVPPVEMMPLACEAAALAFQLEQALHPELVKHDAYKVADQMEFPLIYVLAQMEETGVTIDPQRLAEIETQLEQELKELEAKIFEVAGRPFLIGSPQQVGDILFSDLGLPVKQKTSTGQPSTREDVLLELATAHPLPGLIIDWRKASRLQSTYIDNLKRLIHPQTGRVHTIFRQTVAATGRLSSSDPGLQNIPVRRATGREIRRAFVAPSGHVLLAADYAQIELRILAHMSGDEGLAVAFHSKRDVHTETAAQMLHIDAEAVTREQRNRAKAVNYGIPYGLSLFGLAQQLRCSRDEAKTIMAAYHESFPGIAPFLSEQVERARERGYAETLWGRRRYLPAITARNRMERSAAERIAINMPIQGTQADMIKLAMVNIYQRFKHEGLISRLILQVHDELVFEVPTFEVKIATPIIVEAMTSALPLSVPVEVDVNDGPTWLDAH